MPHLKAKSGINWHYEINGEGEPIVFIHGWGVSRRIWRQQYKKFSQSHKVLLIDLPGHGETQWQETTLQGIAEDIREIFNYLGMSKLNIVGSSFGGLVGIKIAELFPEVVHRLVLVGSTPKFAKSEDYAHGLDVKRIRRLSKQLQSNYSSMVNIFFRSLFTKEERATRRFKWIQTFRKDESLPEIDACLGILEILEKEDLRQSLKEIQAPMQFVYGAEDYICPAEVHDHLKQEFPQARFDIFHQCGHFPFLINPESFNKVLAEFLES